MKISIFIILMFQLQFLQANSGQQSPNENKILFHLHQALYWARAHYQGDTLFAKKLIRDHLGEIKYNEKKLIKSIFYSDFRKLNKLGLNLSKSNKNDIDKQIQRIYTKAKKNNLTIRSTWDTEFLF